MENTACPKADVQDVQTSKLVDLPKNKNHNVGNQVKA
jgi:hypothetical protein